MRVLYICTGNCFRSPVAEALTRKYHPGLEVESAGTHPTDFIAENGKEFLEKEGAEKFVKPSPDRVSQRALDEADIVIVMEEKHRDFILKNFDVSPEKIENWDVEDPVIPGIDDEESFSLIRKKVVELEDKQG